MKKLFIALVLCVLLATPALGDEPVNGTMDVISITDFFASCDLIVSLTSCSGQGPFALPAMADGDLLCGILTDAQIAPFPVDVGLALVIKPTVPPTFTLEVEAVQLGPGDLCE